MFHLKDILRNTPRKGEVLLVFLDDVATEIRNVQLREVDTTQDDSILESIARDILEPKVTPE